MKLGEFSEEYILQRAEEQYELDLKRIVPDKRDTALIVVDMLDEFVKPNWAPTWMPEATRQVPRIKHLIDAFHSVNAAVIFVAYEVGMKYQNFPHLTDLPVGQDFEAFGSELFQRVAIYEELAPGPDDYVVLKHSYSGFQGTPMETVLRNLAISTVVICGTATNFCCGATAREAFWRGFRVIVGSDVTSTDDPIQHRAELRTLRRGYARVMTSEEVIDELRN